MIHKGKIKEWVDNEPLLTLKQLQAKIEQQLNLSRVVVRSIGALGVFVIHSKKWRMFMREEILIQI